MSIHYLLRICSWNCAFDVISVTHRELQDWYKFKRPCITDRTHIKLLDIKPTMVSMSVADQPLNVVPYDEYTLALTKYVRKGYWPNDIISTVLAFDFKKLEWWKYADNLR